MKIDLSRYHEGSDKLIGEVMSIDDGYIYIMLYPDRYKYVGIATPFYISSDECGLIAFSSSNIIKAKYGKEFTLFKRDLREESYTIYPDIKSHYNYMVVAYNVYYVSRDGRIFKRRGCNPSPHDNVYILYGDDIINILNREGFNKDLFRILAEESPKPIFFRELLNLIKENLKEYNIESLLMEMLDALYTAGYSKIDVFIRDFKEVFMSEE